MSPALSARSMATVHSFSTTTFRASRALVGAERAAASVVLTRLAIASLVTWLLAILFKKTVRAEFSSMSSFDSHSRQCTSGGPHPRRAETMLSNGCTYPPGEELTHPATQTVNSGTTLSRSTLECGTGCTSGPFQAFHLISSMPALGPAAPSSTRGCRCADAAARPAVSSSLVCFPPEKNCTVLLQADRVAPSKLLYVFSTSFVN
mmetsp:Transcript_21996/g.61051  ORF Transcript_21996/g.61051 Transcript_21996/m.61051 type:complete len:205 (-) Transcript_21996:1447-2061(-)